MHGRTSTLLRSCTVDRVYTWEYISERERKAVGDLPVEAGLALQDFLTAASLNPWGFAPDGAGNMPTAWFGGRRGLVTFLIMDEDRMLYVTQVTWLG